MGEEAGQNEETEIVMQRKDCFQRTGALGARKSVSSEKYLRINEMPTRMKKVRKSKEDSGEMRIAEKRLKYRRRPADPCWIWP